MSVFFNIQYKLIHLFILIKYLFYCCILWYIYPFINFRQELHESLQRERVWEAFRQVDAYGGRGAIRFRTSIYKTGNHDRALAFETTILYGPNLRIIHDIEFLY